MLTGLEGYEQRLVQQRRLGTCVGITSHPEARSVEEADKP
jgi:hypothetical protein